jgi:hypothetical protein
MTPQSYLSLNPVAPGIQPYISDSMPGGLTIRGLPKVPGLNGIKSKMTDADLGVNYQFWSKVSQRFKDLVLTVCPWPDDDEAGQLALKAWATIVASSSSPTLCPPATYGAVGMVSGFSETFHTWICLMISTCSSVTVSPQLGESLQASWLKPLQGGIIFRIGRVKSASKLRELSTVPRNGCMPHL